jgi:hypothetical protein
MSSGELELIITRNADFLAVRRDGDGDGQAALYNSITGQFIAGIGGGWLPEFSRFRNADNTYLIRGWRNIVYELVARHRLKPTREIRKLLGDRDAMNAHDYGMGPAPMSNPAPAWVYSELRTS